MLETIGWLALLVPLGWLSLFSVFATVPTFGEALFSGSVFERIAGVALWCFTFWCWYGWLNLVTITANVAVD